MYKLTENQIHQLGHISELQSILEHLKSHLITEIVGPGDEEMIYRFVQNEDGVFLESKLVEEHSH